MAEKKIVGLSMKVKRAPAASKPFQATPAPAVAKKPPTQTKKTERSVSPTILADSVMRGQRLWGGPPLPKEHDPKPRWTWDQGVTYSMLGEFMISPQSFWRSYVAGYDENENEGGLSPLGFGNLFHDLSERFFGLVPSKEEVTEAAYHALKAQRAATTDAPTRRVIDRMALTCAMMFTRHQQHWNDQPTYLPSHYPQNTPAAVRKAHPHGIFDRELDVIERERTFKIKHYFTPTDWVWLRGKIDGVFDIPVLKNRSILENKTKSNIDEEGIRETLHEDLQTNIYLYACHRIGYPIEHVLYNVIRRPKHTWNRDKESLIQHVDRIEAETFKKPEHFFKRFSRKVDPSLVEVFVAHVLNPLLWQHFEWAKSLERNPMDPWHVLNADGARVPNLRHFERPYGVYDPYAMRATGHQYDMRILHDYSNYRQIEPEELFPELDEDDDAIIVDGYEHLKA